MSNSNEEQIKNITDEINNIRKSTEALKQNNTNTSDDINSSLNKLDELQNMLENKRNILITRNRMLQLSQDRNFHKQRVIYTILSLIIACILLVIIGYTTFSK